MIDETRVSKLFLRSLYLISIHHSTILKIKYDVFDLFSLRDNRQLNSRLYSSSQNWIITHNLVLMQVKWLIKGRPKPKDAWRIKNLTFCGEAELFDSHRYYFQHFQSHQKLIFTNKSFKIEKGFYFGDKVV